MSKPAYLRSATTGTVTIYLNGKVHNLTKDHINYNKINDVLNSTGPFDKLDSLLNVAQTVENRMNKGNNKGVVVSNGQVYFNGEVVHNTLVDRIVSFVGQNFDTAPLTNCLSKLMDNPSKASLDNLYRFLEHNQMVIAEDGDFLAYKAVRDDYKDCHSGTFDNSVGKVCEMPRNKVQDNPDVTCSYGLHVAALSYVKDCYAGKRVVVVKVNPKDVVSVPTDYNNSKMRVCRYEVIADFVGELKQEGVSMPVDDDEYDDEDDYTDLDEDEDGDDDGEYDDYGDDDEDEEDDFDDDEDDSELDEEFGGEGGR